MQELEMEKRKNLCTLLLALEYFLVGKLRDVAPQNFRNCSLSQAFLVLLMAKRKRYL